MNQISSMNYFFSMSSVSSGIGTYLFLWNFVISCFSGIDFTFLVVACPRWVYAIKNPIVNASFLNHPIHQRDITLLQMLLLPIGLLPDLCSAWKASYPQSIL